MLFTTYIFILLFLPISLVVYFLLNKLRLTVASKAWLVFASLFFYAWWNIKFLPLILGSILFNYTIGASIVGAPNIKKKYILLFGICSNIVLLGYFKYTNFFLSNINNLTGSSFSLMNIILPLGISFFTFTQVAYLVDSYKNESKESNFLNYFLFVTFFPHLLAGPIIHHKEMMPQFDKIQNKILNYKNLSLGLYIFFIGLTKKLLIADVFAIYANNGFDVVANLNAVEAWIASLSYTIQLYFDFSGYTDMAIGCSLMFNIKLPINFNSPYKAHNIQDFWRRWHITLSRFLKDYVYIPLGGNRVTEFGILSNLIITFLIGGLWHGAGWTFVLWGLLHGIAIVAHRLWKKTEIAMPKLVAWFLTFNFINVTWVIFRAANINDAVLMLKGMTGFNGVILPVQLEYALSFLKNYGIKFGDYITHIKADKFTILGIIGVICITVFFRNSNEMLSRFVPSVRKAIITAFLIVVCIVTVLFSNATSEFLYFNF